MRSSVRMTLRLTAACLAAVAHGTCGHLACRLLGGVPREGEGEEGEGDRVSRNEEGRRREGRKKEGQLEELGGGTREVKERRWEGRRRWEEGRKEGKDDRNGVAHSFTNQLASAM